jgi:hypothetical protein
VLFSSSGLALATEPRVFIHNQIESSGNSAAYRTAERLKNAQVPLPPKPLAGFNLQQGFEQAAALAQKTENQHAEVAYENGHSPTLKVRPNYNNRLFEPDPKARAISGSTPTSLDYGGLGAQYTSQRVFPLYTGDAWWYSADVKGPYRMSLGWVTLCARQPSSNPG